MELLSKHKYHESIAASRDARMGWWREARYGMFVHFGLYAIQGTHEWTMAVENWKVQDYEKFADQFNPAPGAPREWARLAKEAGMKYMVMTSRHHDGFSLWDSKANPYNSVNYGPKRDIVREFVDACREFDLKFGFYYSLMDWHHPDGGRAAYDSAARKRFNDYIFELNKELLTNYGKIDILWFDVAAPMESHEGWNSLEMNQRLRALQPHIIINNRSNLPEDFGTPEEHITAQGGDWEACMTFNSISWGYLDSEQAAPYSYNPQRILKMLHQVTAGGGNLLLNIGPRPDGSVPPEAFEPLRTVGKWLETHGEVCYGKCDRANYWCHGPSNSSVKGNNAYVWMWIWSGPNVTIGGFVTKLKKASILTTGQELEFTQDGHRIFLRGLPVKGPDATCNVGVIKLEFEDTPRHIAHSYRPSLHGGTEYEPK